MAAITIISDSLHIGVVHVEQVSYSTSEYSWNLLTSFWALEQHWSTTLV